MGWFVHLPLFTSGFPHRVGLLSYGRSVSLSNVGAGLLPYLKKKQKTETHTRALKDQKIYF